MATRKATVGKTVPDTRLSATGGREFRLSDLNGRWVVLYFYPRDDTPGCTLEGKDFQDRLADFRRLKTDVIGVSRDTLASHDRFRAKHGLTFDLVSDPGEKLCQAFGVIKEKTLYGRKHMGIERSTFIIDPAGILRHEMRKVGVKGHVDEVLGLLRELRKS